MLGVWFRFEDAWCLMLCFLQVCLFWILGFNPYNTNACFSFVFEVWTGNLGKSFDAKFYKPFVLIDLFIMNMRM